MKKKIRLYVGQEVNIIAGNYASKTAWVARNQWLPDSVGVVLDEREVNYPARSYRILGSDEVRPVREMLPALSLKQPWAWLMLRPDITDPELRRAAIESEAIKPIENRKWSTKHRGPVLIHASLGFDHEGYNWVREHFPHIPMPEMVSQYQRGGIVGRFTITDCVKEHKSPWFFGPYGFPVNAPVPLDFIPCRGALNFFTPVLTAEQWANVFKSEDLLRAASITPQTEFLDRYWQDPSGRPWAKDCEVCGGGGTLYLKGVGDEDCFICNGTGVVPEDDAPDWLKKMIEADGTND